MGGNDGGISSVFSYLPEVCVSNIIAFTSPKDACRASAVSWDFKSVSESDTVWERFLPSDYQEIISNCVGPPLNFATKKELFFSLCNFPIIINDGKLSFWLSKSSGKKCYMLSARELSMAWKDTPPSWVWTSVPESRFSEVAELKNISRPLNIRGEMQTTMLSLNTTYAAYLVFKLTENSHGLDVAATTYVGPPEAVCSSSSPSTGHIVLQPISGLVYSEATFCGHGHFGGRGGRLRPSQRSVLQNRRDGWMEILLWEFFNDGGEGGTKIKFRQTRTLNRKEGLILEGIELRPKEDA